ncbi:threonine--tRNA ligase, chloroplastic/mitochondrial 2 isoform X1 [Macadamia integrifolia]|uniref:threonine--tRNA ligase, chloroplastic/mitochondrial 2 isoform X1 n=2 Tax=Macadamia integrifolia TaxID=60698 RepID=UPI001C4E3F1A|nr:threonine--tRNA ligase, chloroplastic/mitochondrial 2 isoform X1 [Macadamia integrifolia]
MAASNSSFTSPLQFSNPRTNSFTGKPCLFLHRSPLKSFISTSRRNSGTTHIRVYSQNRKPKVFSTTPSAVATDSPEAPTVAEDRISVENSVEEREVILPTNESSGKLLRIRHTCAHVMAMAVQKLFPEAKVTIGPWIENGFYYDFDVEPLQDKDLKRIKKEMDRIISRNLPLLREEVSRDEAHKRIMAINEPYKMEILESIKEDPITIYHIGNEWWDLCAGPHVETTGLINKKAVELESVAGAYWRGDEKNPMLQRIYGTAWENEEQLKAYLHFKEEAKRRDHRRIGQDLDLFSIQDEAGGGLVFWHPKGAIVRHIIEDSWKRIHIEHGYDLLYTPHVAKADLWKISGHLDFYKENMYDQMSIEDELYQLRPMNCPYHILVYKRTLHSYRDFPIRVAELGTVYRYELSGSLHGLFRVRGFTQDDAHIFCLENQIKDEIRGVLDLTEEILLQFGFSKYEVNLSTRPEKSVGGDGIWEKATIALKDALDDKGWDYQIDEGGGAFYGPKIDLKIEDALGRKWQCSTVQVDFNLPERFDITYVDNNSEKKRPIMIHRAVLGSLERFFGVLIEHYAGDFPLWLSPIQARVLPVTDTQLEYCNKVMKRLKDNGIRTEACHGERLPKLIRNSEKQKIPLMAVVGPKEAETQTVTVRSRFGGELGTMTIDDFICRIKSAVDNRTSI